MSLTPYQREKLQDCVLLIDSARKTLVGIGADKLPEIDEIRECFDSAEGAITKILGDAR